MSMFLTKDLSEMIDDLSTMFGYHYIYDVPQQPIEELQLELPGVSKECIRVLHKEEFLTIFWLDRKQTERKKQIYVGNIDTVEATYKDGLLTIKTIKKKEDEGTEVKIKGA